MISWRITKYNPIFRDKKGSYLKNDWAASSDIGKFFENKEFTYDEYLKIEDAYIAAILLFMEFVETDTLKITNLAKKFKPNLNNFYSQQMLNAFNDVNEYDIINKNLVELIARLALRENLWCKLESEDMYVHFGYDYYMYIGISKKCTNNIIDKIETKGLFVESYQSPYEEIEN